MALNNAISLHPKLGAAAEALLGFLFIIGLTYVPNLSLLVVLVAARLALSVFLAYVLVYVPPSISRLEHAVTIALFHLGLMPLFLFTDWPPAWYLLAFVSIICPAASFWLMPHSESELSFVLKPYRRLGLLMTALAVTGIWSGVMALFGFQLVPWFSLWILPLASLATTLIGFFWWRRYEIPLTRQAVIIAGVLALLLWEFSFIVLFSPAGNFVGGALLAWLWYILFLMARFYLSPTGLNFKKQVPFVIVNSILMLVFLFLVVRWK